MRAVREGVRDHHRRLLELDLTSTSTAGAATGSAYYGYNADGEEATRSPSGCLTCTLASPGTQHSTSTGQTGDATASQPRVTLRTP